VFRVPHMTDGEKGKAAAGLLGRQYPGGTELSSRSLVNWVLEEIEKKEWVRKAPMPGNC
jgi:hypothetical protein